MEILYYQLIHIAIGIQGIFIGIGINGIKYKHLRNNALGKIYNSWLILIKNGIVLKENGN